MQAIVDDLLDAVAAAGPDTTVDLVSAFAFPLPFTVICELLGVDQADRDELGRQLIALLSPTATAAEYEVAKQASDAVVAMLVALVEAKQREPDDRLVSALIRARDGDERLDQQELLSTIFQLIVAGHDTTASLIGNSVVALLRHPSQLAELRAHPDQIPAAVEEFLRYDAPVPHSTFRYAAEAFELGGHTIPQGAQVIICLASANRDERRIHRSGAPRPRSARRAAPRVRARDPFLPRRRARPHGGELALESVLRRFPALRLAGRDEDLHWGHGDGLVLRGLTGLPVFPGPDAGRLVT